MSSVPKTLSEDAYARLRADLLSARLKPGEKLRFRHLIARYSLGIAPLREALARLASERLVRFEGQRGFAVAPVSHDDLIELCDLRTDLTTKALRRSVERGGVDWESDVLASLHGLERSARPSGGDNAPSLDEWETRHDKFHKSLIIACGSQWLLRFCAELSDQFLRYRCLNFATISESEQLWEEIRSQHRKIADAAIARDSDRAVALLTQHFEQSLDLVLKFHDGRVSEP